MHHTNTVPSVHELQQQQTHAVTHTLTYLMVIFYQAQNSRLLSHYFLPPPLVLNLCILSAHTKSFHILLMYMCIPCTLFIREEPMCTCFYLTSGEQFDPSSVIFTCCMSKPLTEIHSLDMQYVKMTLTGSKTYCVLCGQVVQTGINVRIEQLRQFLSHKLHRVTMGLGVRRAERGETESNFLHTRQLEHLAHLAEQVR